MADYTYYAFTLTTGDVIAELPLIGAKPSWLVNDPGDLGGPTINLAGLESVARSDIRAGTVPWKTGIAVDRDGVIIWSGVVTGRRYASTSKAYTLTVPGLLAYWRRRVLDRNIVYTQTEQFDIVIDLLRYGGNPTIPVVLAYDRPSGVLRDYTITGSELKASIDEILAIADNLRGYELAIDTTWDTTPGTQGVVHYLRIGSPRLGRVDDRRGGLLTLEYPGNVRDYTWDEDGDQFATQVYGTSTDQDGITLTESATNATLLSEGFPQVGATRQWSDITNTNTIEDHLIQALVESNGYQDAPVFTVPDVGETAAGSWTVGDDVRVRVTDDCRFPTLSNAYQAPGLDTTVRLSAATLDPDTRTVQMTMFSFTDAVQ